MLKVLNLYDNNQTPIDKINFTESSLKIDSEISSFFNNF